MEPAHAGRFPLSRRMPPLLDQVAQRLFVDHQKDHIAPEAVVVDFAKGQQRLAEHTATLFGPAPSGRGVRIMVTMPREAADDALLGSSSARRRRIAKFSPNAP
jgi:hypothetical protein